MRPPRLEQRIGATAEHHPAKSVGWGGGGVPGREAAR